MCNGLRQKRKNLIDFSFSFAFFRVCEYREQIKQSLNDHKYCYWKRKSIFHDDSFYCSCSKSSRNINFFNRKKTKEEKRRHLSLKVVFWAELKLAWRTFQEFSFHKRQQMYVHMPRTLIGVLKRGKSVRVLFLFPSHSTFLWAQV